MAIAPELRAKLVEFIRAYCDEQGEKLDERTFQQIEDEACELGDAIAQALMTETLMKQAGQVLQETSACCPECQRPGRRKDEPEPRLLDTRRGPVGWQEPEYYCRHCRRAFFPSVPKTGH